MIGRMGRALVILVEDIKFAADMLRVRFERTGFAVRSAATRAEGMSAWRETRETPRASLVVLDLTLPDGDGLEILREIRRTERRRTPVVVHSSDDGEGRRILAARLLGAEIIRKGEKNAFGRMLALALGGS